MLTILLPSKNSSLSFKPQKTCIASHLVSTLKYGGHLNDPVLGNARIKSLPEAVDHENVMPGLILSGKGLDSVSGVFLDQVMDHFKSWGPYWEEKMTGDLLS